MGEAVNGEETRKPPYRLPGSIVCGRRNNELFRYACSLQAKGRADADIWRELTRANAERCAEPLPEHELADILRKVTAKYEKGTPRAPLREHDAGDGPLAKLGKVRFNDKELSRAFAGLYRDRLRYVPEVRSWYAYDETRWVDGRAGGEQIAQRLMKEFSDALCDAAARTDGEDARSGALRGAARYCQQSARAKLLEDCKSELVAGMAEFDRNPMLFNCKNGTLDLSTMTFRGHNPADMLTKLAGCDYDENAGYREWIEFLEDTLEGDVEVIGFIQRAMGAALVADTTEERFYIAQGLTRTGKSTTLETVMAAMGDYGCTIQSETLQEAKRNSRAASGDVARLNGVRFVVCPEPAKTMTLDVALVKQLTGGDMVTARNLNQGEFSFRPCFQLWINTNYLPEVRDQTLFESQRVVVVPFDNRKEPGERDIGLKERMRKPESLSGVLNWMIGGFLIRRVSSMPVPSACRKATMKYESDSDRIGEFIAECCETGEGLREDGNRLLERYREWAEEVGCGRMAYTGFYKDLGRRENIRDAGRGRVSGKDSRHVFEGIRLREHY